MRHIAYIPNFCVNAVFLRKYLKRRSALRMTLIMSGAGPSGYPAGSRIYEGFRALPSLRNCCNRSRTIPGLPACTVLAFQGHALLWQQQTGFCFYPAPGHRKGWLSIVPRQRMVLQNSTTVHYPGADRYEWVHYRVRMCLCIRDGDDGAKSWR